jgi:ADP-heptose:LPS heptosyltransferase
MQLKVRGGKRFPGEGIERVLIRGTNWIGDVVMTLPAVAAIRKTWPRARISVLAKPWVAEIYRLSPDVDDVIVFQEPGRHDGIGGKLRLAGELRGIGFDCAILLQNAVEAAIIARLAGIPLRAGYNSAGSIRSITTSRWSGRSAACPRDATSASGPGWITKRLRNGSAVNSESKAAAP